MGQYQVEQDGAPFTSASADRRLALLIDAVQEYAIFMLDADGRVATWNPGAERIKGYARGEILGKHFSVFYPAEDIEDGKPARELREATEHGHYRDENWRVRKDGSLFWANVVITAMRGADGQLEGFAKITRDDTDRKMAREQGRVLDRLNDRERIAHGLHERVIRRIMEAELIVEGASSMLQDAAIVQRLEEAVALLDATVRHVRLVALGRASDEED